MPNELEGGLATRPFLYAELAACLALSRAADALGATLVALAQLLDRPAAHEGERQR
ncbi:MAG: hypothetical protein M3296_00115 [Actinomycetota bacterium]|nr:hypothetical protein [Actinomycetota bacterium]